MSEVPNEARLRLVREASAWLDDLAGPAVGATGVLPLSEPAWLTVLEDSGLAGSADGLDAELAALVAEVFEPASFRAGAARVRGLVSAAVEELGFLEAFVATAAAAVVLRDAVVGAAACAFAVVAGDTAPGDLDAARAAAAEAFQALVDAGTAGVVEDRCAAVFGVPEEHVMDARGVFSAARLLAAFYGRYDELSLRLASVVGVVSGVALDLTEAVGPAEALVMSPRPLLTLRTAVRVRTLVRSGLAQDAEGAVVPLRELKLGVERTGASHAALIRSLAVASDGSTREERAVAALDAYRRAAEGQLRPWAWALLRVLGRSGPKPELSTLRNQLVAGRLPLLDDAAEAILPCVRNAAAHEDYAWDDRAGVVHVGDATVTPESLLVGVDTAYAFIAGAETALRLCRAEEPVLAAGLDADDPAGGLREINVRTAAMFFGTNGLRVRRWTHESSTFEVILDELPVTLVNPCAQAVMWASRILGSTDRFVVRVEGRDGPVVDVGRAPLDATFAVWVRARSRFGAMPLSTFLPANTAARLALESPVEAARAAAWHALNDALHAYEEADGANGAADVRAAMLATRLGLVAFAVAVTIPLVDAGARGVLDDALTVIGDAAACASEARSRPAAWEARRRVLDAFRGLPAVSVLPTLDPTPL